MSAELPASLLILVAIGNYGKDTPLGYWGSILVSLVGTPVLALIVITILKSRETA